MVSFPSCKVLHEFSFSSLRNVTMNFSYQMYKVTNYNFTVTVGQGKKNLFLEKILQNMIYYVFHLHCQWYLTS